MEKNKRVHVGVNAYGQSGARGLARSASGSGGGKGSAYPTSLNVKQRASAKFV